MCKNFRTITQVVCKIQLVQFERVKIESRENLNSRSYFCFSRNYFNSFFMLNKLKRCDCVIRTLHEIHVILFDGLPVPSTFFYSCARAFRAYMFLVLPRYLLKNVLLISAWQFLICNTYSLHADDIHTTQ